MTTVPKPLYIRSTSTSITRKPNWPPLGNADSSQYNPRQASGRPRQSHSGPRRPKKSISSGYLSCQNTQFSEESRCSLGYPLSTETTPSTTFDDCSCRDDDGRLEGHPADVSSQPRNLILSDTKACIKNNPEKYNDDHYAVRSEVPSTLSRHQEQSQHKTRSSSLSTTTTDAGDCNWESIPAVEEFENDPAHAYWKWNVETQQWCHIDQEGIMLYCPTMLD